MILPILSLLFAPAHACTRIYVSPFVSPTGGEVPPEIVFVGGGAVLTTADGEDIQLYRRDDDVFAPEAQLAEGAYTLDAQGTSWDLQVVAALSGLTLDEHPVIEDLRWTTERVAERLSASCIEYVRREHVLPQVTLSLPAAPSAGWVVEIEDPANGGLARAPLAVEPSEVSLSYDAGRVRDVEKAGVCLTLRLYDPSFTEVWSQEQECQSPNVGCAVGGAGRGSAAGLLMVLLGLTRRAAARTGAPGRAQAPVRTSE